MTHHVRPDPRAADACAARRSRASIARPGSSRPGCAPTRCSSTRSSTCRSSSSSCSASTPPTRRVTRLGGLQPPLVRVRARTTEVQRYLSNSVIVGLGTAIIATFVGTMAALGLQRAPKWFRMPFDALTYVSVIVPGARHRARHAGVLREHDRPRRDPDQRDRDRDRVRLPHDHRRAVAVQHQPRAAARPGPPVRHGPDASSRRATTCMARRGARSGRSPSRSCCRRSWPGSCCRSRSPSTTT